SLIRYLLFHLQKGTKLTKRVGTELASPACTFIHFSEVCSTPRTAAARLRREKQNRYRLFPSSETLANPFQILSPAPHWWGLASPASRQWRGPLRTLSERIPGLLRAPPRLRVWRAKRINRAARRRCSDRWPPVSA